MTLKKEFISLESDWDLIHGCREDRPDAWQQLLDRYEHLVFSVPLRYGLSDADAADVTQLTFASLIQTLDRLQEDSRLGAWLVTVARHHSWRLLGRNRREIALEDVGRMEDTLLITNDGAETIENWELAEWLNHGLSLRAGIAGTSCSRSTSTWNNPPMPRWRHASTCPWAASAPPEHAVCNA